MDVEWLEDADEPDAYYVRRSLEYVRPRKRRTLVDQDGFDRAVAHGDLLWDDERKDTFGLLVVGTIFNQGLQGRPEGRLWCELVPEPGNPHDHHALAVDVDGVRCGYLPASVAAHFQWIIRALNRNGEACYVAGDVRRDLSQWYDDEPWDDEDELQEDTDWDLHLLVALPTLQLIEALPEVAAVRTKMRQLYDDLPAATKAQIVADDFHIRRRDVAAHIISRRDMVPELSFPSQPNPLQLPRVFNHVLKEVRGRHASERAKAAAVLRQERERERQVELERIRELRVAELAARDAAVLDRHRAGRSRAKVAAEVGLSSQTVSKIVARHGFGPGEAGRNAYGEEQAAQRRGRAGQAVALQVAGLTRAEISEAMGVTTDTVKVLLSLGKFLADPLGTPERLELARTAYLEGWSAANTSGGARLRAIRDARDLLATHPGLLGEDRAQERQSPGPN